MDSSELSYSVLGLKVTSVDHDIRSNRKRRIAIFIDEGGKSVYGPRVMSVFKKRHTDVEFGPFDAFVGREKVYKPLVFRRSVFKIAVFEKRFGVCKLLIRIDNA